MWLIEGVKDFGYWCRVGKRRIISNDLADTIEKRGYLKKIKYLGKYRSLDKVYLIEKLQYHKDKVKYHKNKVKKLSAYLNK